MQNLLQNLRFEIIGLEAGLQMGALTLADRADSSGYESRLRSSPLCHRQALGSIQSQRSLTR